MANETNLFNRGVNGFTSDISLGGLPVYTEDIQNIQTNYTELYGLAGLLKGSACVLRGCLIDDLNIAANTCSITEGVVLLNDTIYYVPAQSLTYPFAIVKGAETFDTRIFKDGSTKDVAIAHSYAIRNTFTYTPGTAFINSYPTDLDFSQGIYFDPFTHQRAEYILRDRAKGFKEVISVGAKLSNITKTETGKSIIGGTLSAYIGNVVITNLGGGNIEFLQYCRWKYAGYVKSMDSFKLYNNGIEQMTNNLIAQGSSFVTLAPANIPPHTHGVNLSVNFSVSKQGGTNAGGLSGGFASSDADGTFPANISGSVAGNTNSGNGLSNSPIDVNGRYIEVNHLFYVGFTGVNQIVSPYGNQNLYYSNM